MKNLFDYATKELSQDAFLRWLFENFDCEDNASLKEASQCVLKRLCGITSEEEIIKSVVTYSQWHKIDIFAHIETNERTIALFVEDKVFSSEHSQLENYNRTIENSLHFKNWDLNKLGCKSENIVKVFYKTLWLSDEETETVKNAGWKIFDITAIKYIFEKFAFSDCTLLRQYAEHIFEIENALKTHNMPKPGEKGLDLIKWKAYFQFSILPALDIDPDKYSCLIDTAPYNYVYLSIRKKIPGIKDVPYIELRSRDVSDDGASITFLCFGVDYKKYGDKIKRVEERLRDAPNQLFIQKFKRKDEPKQLARTPKTNENIVSFLQKCLEDYAFAMQVW